MTSCAARRGACASRFRGIRHTRAASRKPARHRTASAPTRPAPARDRSRTTSACASKAAIPDGIFDAMRDRFRRPRQQCRHVAPRASATLASERRNAGPYRGKQDRPAAAVVVVDAQHTTIAALVDNRAGATRSSRQRIRPYASAAGAMPSNNDSRQVERAASSSRPPDMSIPRPCAQAADGGRRGAGRHPRRSWHPARNRGAHRCRWYVQCQHGSRTQVDPLDQHRRGRVRRAWTGRSEQGVDDQAGTPQRLRRCGDAATRRDVFVAGALRQRRGRRLQAQHPHVAPRPVRMPRQHVAIAAVVARSAGHHDPLLARPVLQRAAPAGLPGARHQGEGVAPAGRAAARFQQAQGIGIEQGQRRDASAESKGRAPSRAPILRRCRRCPITMHWPTASARLRTRPASSAWALPGWNWRTTKPTCAAGPSTACTARWTGWRAWRQALAAGELVPRTLRVVSVGLDYSNTVSSTSQPRSP